ncbi:hypothetical protein XELAEV_18047590mg [Xenopus laevis]|uniref:Ubiquitin-like protease family profile domain-containing protein n=1 Tax=Xenopus laevis TaxID=8355 RepID=A0A974H1Q1_XENLA|nr:hypothetical protein XELAEV_18047590mg [Xenopus laevis]
MARKMKRNKKQTTKLEIEEKPSICQKEENSKKMARKERKMKKHLMKAKIEKTKQSSLVGLYRPLYAGINEEDVLSFTDRDMREGTNKRQGKVENEENTFSDDSSCSCIEVPGQPFPVRTGDWIPELNLTQQHKMALDDHKIINAAQSLLKIHFEETEGLQNSAEIKHHCTSLRRQINECYSALVCDPEGTMEILDVDEQVNTYDCGVYVIANAFEFLSGRNPICKYNHNKTRRHLICCFNIRKFTAFPKIVHACAVHMDPKINFTWLNREYTTM